jgi:GTP1/Obg family GTP-binding protein
VASDYVRLLKYGDSLYRCKELKRAAFGKHFHFIVRERAAAKIVDTKKKLILLSLISKNY